MSVYMFLLLYHSNSLRGQSGRYPMYRGVQMYNSALFPFIVWLQYFLKYFEYLKVVWGSDGCYLVGWFLLGSKSSQGAEYILFELTDMLLLCFYFLALPVLFMALCVKLGISLSGSFLLMWAMQWVSVAWTVIWSCSWEQGAGVAFPVCFPRCSCFLVTAFHWVPVLMDCAALNLVSSRSCSISVRRYFFSVFSLSFSGD